MSRQLPAYKNLMMSNQGAPCSEYPGRWIVFICGKETSTHPSFDAALLAGHKEVEIYGSKDRWEPINITIGWQSSDNDPRMKEGWFRSSYCHGRFNQFGEYRRL